jgi:hypothetical protein
MRRTGDRILTCAAVAACLLAASPALAEDRPEFRQSADRKEMGSDDTFRLTISISNAPDGAQLTPPSTDDFEVLSKSQSTEMSYQMIGSGPGVIRRVNKWILVMRPNRVGALVVPPSELRTPNGSYKTDPVTIVVKKGHIDDPNVRPTAPTRLFDPFQSFPFPEDDESEQQAQQQAIPIPRSDSDLFLRTTVDRDELFVGEQATLSLYIFSRVDLSSVDSLTMPKLDGFWSEDVDSPSQLTSEAKVIGGVPYRAYLLKRRALFPVRAGQLKIGSAEADVTTGFLFAGRRVHRKSNDLVIKVKTLPSARRPKDFPTSNIGVWRMQIEPATAEVDLGQPVTVKLTVEGRGNLRTLAIPPLNVPPGLRVFDPTVTDKQLSSRGRLGGRRTLEYLVMPQQTGAFTIPALEMPYFDPDNERYDVAQTEPVQLMITGAQPKVAAPGALPEGGKNVLEGAQKLKPLRSRAAFAMAGQPLWERPVFAVAVAAPVALWLSVLGIGFIRSAAQKDDPQTRRRRRAKAARARLSAAEALIKSGDANAFYGEVEKALHGFIEARLGEPVAGLTRAQLLSLLRARGVPAPRGEALAQVLDQCDEGRFAPGAHGGSRDEVIAAAAALMEDWPA